MTGRKPVLATLAIAMLAGACGGSTSSSGPSPVTTAAATPSAAAVSSGGPSASTASSAEQWAADLDQLDAEVRAHHPNPFKINPETAWVAKLAELRTSLPAASRDQQIVGLASLVGLLDTHSSLDVDDLRMYDVLLYRFPEGWFVDAARDPTLIGDRLVSINGHSAADIETLMRPLVPADNESGELDGLWVMSLVEYLHGLGVVDDPAKPAFVFERPDGTRLSVDPGATDVTDFTDEFKLTGDLVGDAPEAVARRAEPTWGRLDKPTKTFIVSYNDYTDFALSPVLAEMDKALDDKTATRVVLDNRYLRGGYGNLADPLIDALTKDPRINRPGGLIVMIGRENVSAGTVVARRLDAETKATLVGEMTPARADGYLCDCYEITLPKAGLIVTVPTFTFGLGDPRPAIAPDIPMALAAKDFFAGKDPVLDAVLALPDPPKK